MIIKIRTTDRKLISVDVNEPECRKRKCFIWGKGKWSDNRYSCLIRDNHGCPENKEDK